MTTPTSLIINSAFEEPQQHWAENPDRTLRLEPVRRPAGYEIIDTRENTRRMVALPLVDQIRERVRQWREAGWPGSTAVTQTLLQHWWDADKTSRRQWPFYFCQLEAVETLIWHLEALPEFRQGIYIAGDGGPFERLCSKMATGSGKTTVMAMIITWQVLNALTYPKSPRKYSSAVFLVAPGLTVKARLQVLLPGHPENYYDLFELCPSEALRSKLNRAQVLIENWHALMPLKEPERSVVRKGQESDEAFARRVRAVACGTWPTALPAGVTGDHTGNPVRQAVLDRAGAPYIPPGDYPMSLVVIGGSQGARILSDVVPEAIVALPEPIRRNLRVAHQARAEDQDRVVATYAAAGILAEVEPFFADIPRRLSEAQLVISRSGASSIADISVIGRPAILIPFAAATADHQTANARGLVSAEAAILIPESALDPATLSAHIAAVLSHPEAAGRMAANALAQGRPDASDRLVDLVLRLSETA